MGIEYMKLVIIAVAFLFSGFALLSGFAEGEDRTLASSNQCFGRPVLSRHGAFRRPRGRAVAREMKSANKLASALIAAERVCRLDQCSREAAWTYHKLVRDYVRWRGTQHRRYFQKYGEAGLRWLQMEYSEKSHRRAVEGMRERYHAKLLHPKKVKYGTWRDGGVRPLGAKDSYRKEVELLLNGDGVNFRPCSAD
ncbi:MAG: hypothetical protein AAFV69_10325 [Pseudomonadota bacterium]